MTNNPSEGKDMETTEGYCFKCKGKRTITDPTETRTRNGRMAVYGTCATCGGKMYKIGGVPASPSEQDATTPT